MITVEEKTIRALAREYRYQLLYSRAKELSSMYLFENRIDFSKLQMSFLSWLETYNSIYIDIACDEELIDDERIKDDILVDAYLVYKKRERQQMKDKVKNPQKIKDNKPTERIVFKEK